VLLAAYVITAGAGAVLGDFIIDDGNMFTEFLFILFGCISITIGYLMKASKDETLHP
jgi:predicted membrane-bound spermidine synthase